MSRYIDADRLLLELSDLIDEFSELDESGLHNERWCGIMDSKGIIVNAPSIDIEPKRGEWTKRTHNTLIAQVNFAYCSECGQPIMHEHTRSLWNFCPNCGARMKGVSTDIDCFDTCKHAYSEVCDECYKGNKYDALKGVWR